MPKKKWPWIVLGVLAAAAVLLFAFWDSIVIYAAPKSVLSKALYHAVEDLQTRYQQSPVSMLVGHLDPGGQYTGQMTLDTENEILGAVRYDMTVQADASGNRLSAQGVVSTSQNELDMSVYLDRDFMALSSGDLLGGAYYGITYDTFPEDIRSIPLISMFVGESILSGWDASVDDIRNMMNRSYRLPAVPELSVEDIRRAMTAAMLLPSRVSRVELPYLGVYTQGYRIDYEAKGEQVGQVLSCLMDTGDGSDAQVHAVFYLYEDQLVMMQLDGEAGGNQIAFAVEFAFEATARTFRFSVTEQGQAQGFCLRHEAERGDGYLNEAWTIHPSFEAEGEGKSLRYRWEPVMGELVLFTAPAVKLNIFETEDGLNIQTDRLDWLMNAISGKETNLDSKEVTCRLIIQKGTQVATPEYKNISQWSLEDLLILLGGVGSLFGIKTS